MLTALRIADFATLEEAELTLGPGLTVLTGETGAGKSLLVGALGLLLGGRGDAGMVRAGADEAQVEASFIRTPILARRLEALGLPDLGEEVSIRRVLHRSGRGKVHVNGALVTVGVLSQLLHGLFDIAGQLDQVSLFVPSEHRVLLDRAGKLDRERGTYAEVYARLRALDARRAELGLAGDDAQIQAQQDFVAFQLRELEALAPVPGEEAGLEVERRRLGDAARLVRAAQTCEQVLETEEGAARERVERAQQALREVRASDPALNPLADRLESLSVELADLVRSLERYGRSVEMQPDRLEEVEERLTLYRRLARKHATDAAGLVQRQKTLAEELDRLSRRDEAREALDQERRGVLAEAQAAAEALSAARRRVGRQLSDAVSASLASLAMPRAHFEVQVKEAGGLGPEGLDEVQFLFCANAGELLRPLARVASGGEASRLLLALRRELMSSDEGMGCVLDEADAGVSGAVADVVGRQMKEVSRDRQVLCITHLPQVAAYGDAHWVVEKREEAGRTRSRIRPLRNEEARTLEVARMLSGQRVTREALGAAEALVRSAGASQSVAARLARRGTVRVRRSA